MVLFFRSKTENCKNVLLLILFFGVLLSFVSCSGLNQISMNRPNEHIGLQIKKIRIEKGISQKELAVAVNMTEENLMLVEKGLATPIHYKLTAIQEYLNAELVIGDN